MEDLMMRKRPAFMPSSITPASPLTMHRDSHTIDKVKPKIRIIHIFAPEIIKTDVANFRELVQRLTGKPTVQKGGCKKKATSARTQDQPRNCNNNNNYLCDNKPVMTKKVELRSGFGSTLGSRERVKEEEEIWNGPNSGGFLGGFTDLDGFIQELGEFPLLPMDANHMQGFGETQLA
uniref:VQ domain-containing protein n=1 Tax=Populus trichocarpa TaxID=3694 RepID=A0A2K2A4M3_POPTR|eukprot:XP_002309306.3 VQ motif-containing protein 25 [Populus trichocarpa]